MTSDGFCPGLFPLPLTPFEYYYWCDDRQEYPTAFPVELTFSGSLEPETFGWAAAVIVARHPLLSAQIRSEGRGAPVWVEGDGRPPAVDWANDDRPISHADGQRIDLAVAPGFRIWVRRIDDTTRVVLQFHHACCDGLAAIRVIEDLLVAYHELSAGRNPQDVLKPLEPQRLRARANYGAEAPARPSFRDLWVGIRGWTKLLAQSPAPLGCAACGG